MVIQFVEMKSFFRGDMKIVVFCAWCGLYLSEYECTNKNIFQGIAINGVIESHGICPHCQKKIKEG